MLRIIVRIALVISGILAIGVILYSFFILGPKNEQSWAVIAASLAVITSILSSWPAQRVLELQQDAKQPFPYPSFDVRSR